MNPRQLHSREGELRHVVEAIPQASPVELYQAIRQRGYIGQEQALKAVSLWAYRHVARLRRIHLQNVAREQLPAKTNMLFVGPTGCGKTFLVELLFREMLRLPTVITDMTGYSETGYVGQDVVNILTHLLYAAQFSPLAASIGIVCLDEFDKIASGQNNAVFAGAGTTKDVSGLGVQRELLKMLESAEILVPAEFGHSDYAPKAVVPTRDIVFIGCGAFSGLKVLIERGGGEHIGFGRAPLSGGEDRIAVSYSEAEMDLVRHFQNYGFLPELIGRFQRIVPFEALSHAELKSILEERVLQQYLTEFRLEGIALEVDTAVLSMIVERSLRMETGARGIDAAFIRYLENAAFESYSREGVHRVRLFRRGDEVAFETG
jgi:ATP-dependent Clp protease ATP-binding subunit ClpX